MKINGEQPIIFTHIDQNVISHHSLEECVIQMIRGGSQIVQFSVNRRLSTQLLSLTFRIKSICHFYHVPFIINNSLKLAMQCDADGIYIDDMQNINIPSIKQYWRKRNLIIGATVKSIYDVQVVKDYGANYITIPISILNDCQQFNSMDFQLVNKIAEFQIPILLGGNFSLHQLQQMSKYSIHGFSFNSNICNYDNILQYLQYIKQLLIRSKHYNFTLQCS